MMGSTITTLLASIPYLYAEEAPKAPQGGAQSMGLILIFMIVLMYFVMIRPQRMRQKQLQAQLEAMKKGDRVVSAGGIHGIVENVKQKTVSVRVAENTRIEFEKTSIAQVRGKGETAESEEEKK